MAGPTERNQCGVITLFPMYVSCNTTNPSSPTASDGVASLFISGGTPPYSIVWANGSVTQSINNLSVGTYTATVTDSNGDFTINTNCVLSSTTTTTTSTTTTTTLPPCVDFCLDFTPIEDSNIIYANYY
jgi:hypothetical protein